MIEVPRTPSEFAQLKKLCVEKICLIYERARKELNLKINDPKIKFSLSGKAAGKARWQTNEIYFNQYFLFHNPDAFLADCVLHESAHCIAGNKYQGNLKPHGIEWENVAKWCGLLKPTRCHNFPLENLPAYAAQAARRKTLIRNAFSNVKTIPNGKIINFD